MALPSQPILGIIDGIEVLQLIPSFHSPCSGAEIAKELRIEKTKVNRILKTFAHLGLVHQTNNRKYISGPGIHILSAQTLHASGLIQKSLKSLYRLTSHKMIVAMGMLWRDKVTYLYHRKPGIPQAEGLGRMDLLPATNSAICMILLAEKTDEELKEIGGTKEDIEGFQSFMESITSIRERGYAARLYENKTAVAVAIGKPAIAAIAFADERLTKESSGFLPLLKREALEIQKNGL